MTKFVSGSEKNVQHVPQQACCDDQVSPDGGITGFLTIDDW